MMGLVLLFAGCLIAFLLGRRRKSNQDSPWVILFGVWTALLLLMTLHQAARHFDAQNQLIRKEADLVSDLYRQMQNLPEANRTQLRSLLVTYLDAKLTSRHQAPTRETEGSAEVFGIQNQLYLISSDLTARNQVSDELARSLQNASSQVISVHFHRAYGAEEQIAPPFWLLLCLHCWGLFYLLASRERPEAVHLLLMLATAGSCLLIADFDHPHSGWMQLNTSNLQDLSAMMHSQENF